MSVHENIVFSALLLGGIVLIVSIIVAWDWLARRKDRPARDLSVAPRTPNT
jgi:hypothetical protein